MEVEEIELPQRAETQPADHKMECNGKLFLIHSAISRPVLTYPEKDRPSASHDEDTSLRSIYGGLNTVFSFARNHELITHLLT